MSACDMQGGHNKRVILTKANEKHVNDLLFTRQYRIVGVKGVSYLLRSIERFALADLAVQAGDTYVRQSNGDRKYRPTSSTV